MMSRFKDRKSGPNRILYATFESANAKAPAVHWSLFQHDVGGGPRLEVLADFFPHRKPPPLARRGFARREGVAKDGRSALFAAIRHTSGEG